MDIDILSNIYESGALNKIYGMGETTIEDIKNFTQYAVEKIINDNDLPIDIIEIYIKESEINNNPHRNYDLDIILYYNGNLKENNLSDILHKEKYVDILTYDKVYINLIPKLDKNKI